jgi:predicted acyl esterase
MLHFVLTVALILCQTCDSESLGYALPRSMASSLIPCSLNMTYEVEMPDGVKVRFVSHIFPRFSHLSPQLSTLVAPCPRPPCPSLLQRTPYDKTNLARLECGVLQQRGFNAVFQDVRGTHASAGNFSMFLLDGSDGYATMEWIALQSWHLGGIVTNGMSALGIAQFAVAVLQSPHHAGMWIDWASPSGKSP